MAEIKFDIHLNVGKVYRTKKPGSVEMFYSGKEIAKFVNYYGITHGVCIYDNYENLKELIDNTDAKIYGVQWVVDKDQDLDIGKKGFYGIKLHSHRGYRDAYKYDWTAKGKKGDKGSLSYGLHYSDKYVKDILERLPTDSLVYMHTQGWPSIDNRARPEHLFMLATEFNNLKFIMGHAGGYGAMNAAYPGNNPIPYERERGFGVYKQSIRNYTDSVVQFNSAVKYANLVHNLFLDSSCWTQEKALGFRGFKKWTVGSDYPFGANKKRNSEGNEEGSHFNEDDFKRSYVWNFDKQYKLFADIVGTDQVNQSFLNAYNYINTSCRELAEEHRDRLLRVKANIKKACNADN